MEQYIRDLTQSPAFSLASFAVGVLGIILAVAFYHRTKRTKCMSYAHRSIPIFRDSAPLVAKLQVQYDGKSTKNLTLTHVAFWNSGNETIRDIDLVSSDPLRITVEDGSILDAELIYAAQKANGIATTALSSNSADLSFRFLDAQHGGVVRVIHTATSRRHIDMKGTLMGVGEPKEIAERMTDRVRRMMPFSISISDREFKWMLTATVLIMTGLLMTTLLWPGTNGNPQVGHNSSPQRFLILLVLVPYWFMVAGAHRRQLPKELEKYLQDFGTESKA